MKIQRPEEINTPKIKELARKHRVRKVITEPKNEEDAKYLDSCGYKQTSPYLPSKTLHLDLTNPKPDLLGGMERDTSSAISETKKLKPREAKSKKELEKFRAEWRNSVGLKRHVPSVEKLTNLKDGFGEDALFLSIGDSGAIFLKTNTIAYYWQAFTGKAGRESLAQYKIVWEGILWAKTRGVKIFDFEGIYDERFPDKSWKGFTHFKKSFGGEEIIYPGAFTLNLLPFRK